MTVEELQAEITSMAETMRQSGSDSPCIQITIHDQGFPTLCMMEKRHGDYKIIHSSYAGTADEQIAKARTFVADYKASTQRLAEILGIDA